MTTKFPGAVQSLLACYDKGADQVSRMIGDALIALAARVALAAVFFLSGRTKVDGLLTVNDSAYTLFRDEYKVPLIPPELAAHMATYAEHVFPILLALGLFTRFAALSLFGMTLVIQLFVYPSAWPTHLSWAAMMLYLMARGGGTLSMDSLFKIK